MHVDRDFCIVTKPLGTIARIHLPVTLERSSSTVRVGPTTPSSPEDHGLVCGKDDYMPSDNPILITLLFDQAVSSRSFSHELRMLLHINNTLAPIIVGVCEIIIASVRNYDWLVHGPERPRGFSPLCEALYGNTIREGEDCRSKYRWSMERTEGSSRQSGSSDVLYYRLTWVFEISTRASRSGNARQRPANIDGGVGSHQPSY
jgi:hypothetical protein